MDLLFQHLAPSTDSSFKIHHEKLSHFIVPCHYHPEIEIMYILKGTGTRFVGDNIEQFDEGDFVMVGSNIPHVWKNDYKYYQKNIDLHAECLVLFIPPEILGEPLLSLPEMAKIKRLFEKSNRGIKFSGKRNVELKQIMNVIFESNGTNRLINVLQLLHKMSTFKNAVYLSSMGYRANLSPRDFGRLTHCIEYLMANFHKKIELTQVADIANMTPNSFCRYFKKRTTKTFSEFVIELRVGKACQLLNESDNKVIEIAFESGFNNLSNFNEHFKKMTGMSPKEYRNINRNSNHLKSKTLESSL
ncbi:AraC family transcriptional regulator [Maribellus luteus]|uniref:AraC family transcriptional regulator n=1 Tax=Maribellus luteus TaxID=2305463 RepID=A0A399T9C9_9BACT|nr:AraC family transcriptional regulator [Maribellus luteus]RIJ50817.1 AraC family transcriptional regulator [Maribellus luteus]